MEQKNLNILMVASECRGLVKVGGLGDVAIDLPVALKKKKVKVSIIIPYYEIMKCESTFIEKLNVNFGLNQWDIDIYKTKLNGIDVYLLKNQYFFGGEAGEVYIDSDKYNRGPFEDDAKRFAFFNTGIIKLLEEFQPFQDINLLHCHDWHSGVLLTLLKFDPKYTALAKKYRKIFTIHNLDYQGVRPFETAQTNLSTFQTWFPDLYEYIKNDKKIYNQIKDNEILFPCYNPMRAAIKSADYVNTVSPSYAYEITQKDDKLKNFIGGRGLEKDLHDLLTNKKLSGILNGLDYDINDPMKLIPPYDYDCANWYNKKMIHKSNFINNFEIILKGLTAKYDENKFINKRVILEKLKFFDKEEWLYKPLIVSVTRAVSQKMGIIAENYTKDHSMIDEILNKEINLIVIGTGELQFKLEKINDRPNGFFICAFDSDFAKLLYSAGDMFFMPSDFEPCGISQMIAMRYGCLPIVNNIGGLHDTVKNMKSGFVYTGTNRNETKKSMLLSIDNACKLYNTNLLEWQAIQKNAMIQRFEWSKSADDYINIYLIK